METIQRASLIVHNPDLLWCGLSRFGNFSAFYLLFSLYTEQMYFWREWTSVFLKGKHIIYNLLELVCRFWKDEEFLGRKADDKLVGQTKSTRCSSTTTDEKYCKLLLPKYHSFIKGSLSNASNYLAPWGHHKSSSI